MSGEFVSRSPLPDYELWGRRQARGALLSFAVEVTARCNNDCRHCYINLAAGDRVARSRELTTGEVLRIADEAVELGALWCLLTGGEPLLRDDFAELYVGLRRRGLLVSVFTNATLITREHVDLFRSHPPRDLEVTVYGVTRESYERVTRRRGSFAAFRRGLDLLFEAGLRVRFKSVALRSNVHELSAIAEFCREHSGEVFRFDPLLHLRFDGDPLRNEEIRAERLSPEEIVAAERADPERFAALTENCDKLIVDSSGDHECDHLFHCGAGCGSFNVGYDGIFRVCSALVDPATTFDLRAGTLREAWEEVVPRVRDLRSTAESFLGGCRTCSLANLCLWCPAHAALETGALDGWVDYFCAVAHARARALGTA